MRVEALGLHLPMTPLGYFRSVSIRSMLEQYKKESGMTTENAVPQGRDLSDEQYREYDFPNGRLYRIENPKTLFVGSTCHRVVDSQGMVHCMLFPGNGVVLRWKPRDPNNPVKF